MTEHIKAHPEIFKCPDCSGRLDIGNGIKCLDCGRSYESQDGIPLFFLPNNWSEAKEDVTGAVKEFYEMAPFPNYDGIETTGDLIEKAERSVFAFLLNEQVPLSIRVLEVGCGTGQMSNYLGIGSRFVFGADMCRNSLKLADDFRKRAGLENVGFYEMNLFRPIFKDESFPLVICNGVLHHTSDPFLGFRSIARLVKKGGYIVLGLYNKYGRVLTDIQRFLFNIRADNAAILDKQLKKNGLKGIKRAAWFLDQYRNPHESRHTIKEVVGWFEKTGFEFINSIPKPSIFESFSKKEQLFKKADLGNAIDLFLSQSGMLFFSQREGGLFMVIGRKL